MVVAGASWNLLQKQEQDFCRHVGIRKGFSSGSQCVPLQKDRDRSATVEILPRGAVPLADH